MISGRTEVNEFASFRLILEAKIGNDYLKNQSIKLLERVILFQTFAKNRKSKHAHLHAKL